MTDYRRDNPTLRRRERVTEDNRRPSTVSSDIVRSQCPASVTAVMCDRGVAGDCNQMTETSSALSRPVSRQPSYLNAVNRRDELVYRDADPQTKSTPYCRSNQGARLERSGMHAIPENEEYQPSSYAGRSAIRPQCCADSGMQDNRRMEVGASEVGKGDVGRGSQADMWQWCKESAADDGAAAIETYIRRDDVRKVLQLCGQKMAASAARKSSAQFNQTPSGLQQGSAVNRGSFGLQKSAVAHQEGSSGSYPVYSTDYPPAANLQGLRPNADAVDSVSISSQKDSGYRSEDDRHSGEYSSDSPTLSASNSAVSLLSNSNCAVGSGAANYSDVKSLCSSYESLCSVQSRCSLPVTMETRLRAVPDGSQDCSSATRLRHEAKEFFSRSARVIGLRGHQQPVKTDHPAVINSNGSVSSASVHQGTEFTNRPASGIQLHPRSVKSGPISSGSDGRVRHAESVPAVNRLSEGDAAVSSLQSQYRRSTRSTSSARRSTGNVMAPSGSRSVPHLHEVDQSASRRVQGREYIRETGSVAPSLRNAPMTSKPADYRHLIRHTALPTNKPAWK